MNEKFRLLLQKLEDIGIETPSEQYFENMIAMGFVEVTITNRYRPFEIRWYSEENILSLHITNSTQVSNIFMKHLIELNAIVADYNFTTEQAEESYFND